MRRIKPDVLMESTSHSEESLVEAEETMKELGGRVVVLPYFPTQSSTSIKDRIFKQNGGNDGKKD